MEFSLQVNHQQVFKGPGVLNTHNNLIFFKILLVFETVAERCKWKLEN